jgi:DNA polymerase III epsilon subunit family exonuclease
MHDQTAELPPAANAAGYPQLLERAIACVEEHHGALDEDQLIAHVFGSAAAAGLWRPLLRGLLEHQTTLTLRGDGVWTTRTAASTDGFPAEYVIVDVETTGLKPSQQRVIEIAIIRVSEHGAPLVWSTLLDPGRKIPQYIASLTGISDQLVAGAPEFRSVAQTVIDIIGDAPIVGHNAAFDIGFINAELGRCGQPRLVNSCLDTLSLANALLKDQRRLNLADVARGLGVEPRRAHRALPDAETTLDVFRLLAGRAREAGLGTLDGLLKLCAGRTPRVASARPAVGRGRAVLDRSHLADIPNAPGVYIMRDKDERVLYVGKSKELRKRVASYYSQPLGYTRKMDGLLEALAGIEVEVVGSELEALVLESQLIRRYRPRFNTVQRNAEQYVYIKVDISNPWPRVTATKDRAQDGAVYYGPFHSAGRVRDAVELVNSILPLRTCRRSFADARSYGSPCLELSLKRCLGPCMGVADREVYTGLVKDVLAFFNGDTSRLIVHLHNRLEDTVRLLDFERAARLRDQLVRIERLVLEQRRIDEAARHGHALLVLPSATPQAREVWYLLRGRRWAQLTVLDATTPAQLLDRLRPVAERAQLAFAAHVPDQHAVDEMALVAKWLRKTPDHPAFIPLDATTSLDEACVRTMMLDLSTPFGVATDAPAAAEDPDAATSEVFEDDWGAGDEQSARRARKSTRTAVATA